MIAQIDDAQSAGTNSRGELMGKLRALFDDVKFYMAHRLDYDRAATKTLSAPAADLEALIPVVQGRMPIMIDADRVDEIDAALQLARDYNRKGNLLSFRYSAMRLTRFRDDRFGIDDQPNGIGNPARSD